jgi:hypothetical protein
MGRRGPPPRSAAEHYRRGTYRRDRHGPLPEGVGPGSPKLASSWPRLPEEPVEPPGLNDGQQKLLKACPSYLTPAQKKRYHEAVLDAWWLEPIDLGLLEAWVLTWDAVEDISRKLNLRMADPLLLIPVPPCARKGWSTTDCCRATRPAPSRYPTSSVFRRAVAGSLGSTRSADPTKASPGLTEGPSRGASPKK